MRKSDVMALVLGPCLLARCSFETKEGTGALGAGSGPNWDGSVSERSYTASDSHGGASDSCASNSFTANNLPPDLLIVLDRSGSMNEDSTGKSCTGGCGANSKWTQMTTAINQVVAGTESKVRWGLKLFASTGDSGSCSVDGKAEVPVGAMNASAIAAAIAAAKPGSSTPTRAAETQAAAVLAAVTDSNPKYLLLATDGLPNCKQGGSASTADDTAAISAVETVAAMGIPTFVIGIATNGTADGTLNMMAVKGGHPRATTPQYYPVSTATDLEAALMQIETMVALPCQFQLGGVPSNLGAVTVLVDGQSIPMSEWMYGPGNRSIIFPDSGAVCGNLKAGVAKDVKIILPCGETIIP